MAELKTSILDWSSSTVATDNVPLDSSDINSDALDQYAGIANFFRDAKAVIRSESLNFGFDPSSTFQNTTTGNWLAANMVGGNADLHSVKLFSPQADNFALNKKLKEGQKLFLSLANASGEFIYYSASVLSFDSTLSGSIYTIILNLTGMTRWEPSSDSVSGAELTAFSPRDSFDLDGVNDTTRLGSVNSSISFSSYPPVNNPGYALLNADTEDHTISQNLSSIPWNQQSGSFVLLGNVDTKVVVFAHPEPDVGYTVNFTAYDYTSAGMPVNAWMVKNVIKQKNFFVVQFNDTPSGATTSTVEKLYWDWEIHRDY